MKNLNELKVDFLKTLPIGTEIIIKWWYNVNKKGKLIKVNKVTFWVEIEEEKYKYSPDNIISFIDDDLNSKFENIINNYKKTIKNKKENGEMLKFTYKNNNPKENEIGDCVIRAISEATGDTWENTMINVVKSTVKTGYIFNQNNVYFDYIEKNGFSKIDENDIRGKTIEAYINELGKDCVYIFKIKGHLTCVKNKELIDTWDCSDKKIIQGWIKFNDN